MTFAPATIAQMINTNVKCNPNPNPNPNPNLNPYPTPNQKSSHYAHSNSLLSNCRRSTCEMTDSDWINMQVAFDFLTCVQSQGPAVSANRNA